MAGRTISVAKLGLLIFISIAALAPTAMAWSYQSFGHGYSLSLPDDWAQVPQEVLAANLADLSTKQTPRGEFDVLFQRKGESDAIRYPYILVEMIPYERWGYDQQVTDQTIQQIVQNNTGMDPANPFVPEGKVMEGGAESESLEGVLGFDASNRKFSWDTTVNDSAAGLLRMRQWGFFGRQGLVLVTLHEQGTGSDRLRGMASAVAGSFKFDVGHDYQPSFTLSDAMGMGRQLFAAPNLGLAATFVCIGTALLFAMICFITGRRTPSYQQYKVRR